MAGRLPVCIIAPQLKNLNHYILLQKSKRLILIKATTWQLSIILSKILSMGFFSEMGHFHNIGDNRWFLMAIHFTHFWFLVQISADQHRSTTLPFFPMTSVLLVICWSQGKSGLDGRHQGLPLSQGKLICHLHFKYIKKENAHLWFWWFLTWKWV